MNNAIAYAGVETAVGPDVSPHSSTDVGGQPNEPFLTHFEAEAISDARLYLVAMGALFSAPSPSLPERKKATIRTRGE